MLKFNTAVFILVLLSGCGGANHIEVDQTNTTPWPAYTYECVKACEAFKAGEREFPDHCGTDCSQFLEENNERARED